METTGQERIKRWFLIIVALVAIAALQRGLGWSSALVFVGFGVGSFLATPMLLMPLVAFPMAACGVLKRELKPMALWACIHNATILAVPIVASIYMTRTSTTLMVGLVLGALSNLWTTGLTTVGRNNFLTDYRLYIMDPHVSVSVAKS